MNKLELKKFVEENPKLVKMRESSAYPGLYVLKYSKSVFYNDLWNDYLEECRGAVIDKDFNIVSIPFKKIYNLDIEKKAPILSEDTPVTAYRKVNGFMVAVTWHSGDILVSTTGSLDSDFVAMARELIDVDRFRSVCSKYENFTFLFEACHPDDPHIIPEKTGMYLLGYRFKDWGSTVSYGDLENLAAEFYCLAPAQYKTTLGELKTMAKECKHEGFVAHTDDGKSFKIKSKYYLTSKWVARNPRTDKLVDMKNDIKKHIEEEFYGLIDAIRANIIEYTEMDEQSRLSWCRKFLGEQNGV